jgi:hypothetical protein
VRYARLGADSRGGADLAGSLHSCLAQVTLWSYMHTQPAVFHFDGVLGGEPVIELALA